jgi:Domain of unknown function (DUF1707)
MATGSNIRVGDAERDAVATQLREHYGDGRLTLDELNERLDQALRARTGADLNAVMRDLPSLGSPWASATTGTTPLTGQSGQLPPGGQSQWGGRSDQGNGFGPRRGLSAVAAFIPALLGVWALLIVAGFLAFGPGGGRPLAIVLFFAALAVIRRMFGGRRGRPSGRRCGRRW